MRNLLFASAAILALGMAAPAYAQTTSPGAAATVGGGAGAAGGAVAGALIGGPIGAVVGGFAGAVLGAGAGVDAATADYAIAHPVEPVYVQGPVDIGYAVPAEMVIQEVPNDPAFGYVYINNRVYIVDLNTRQIVQSPGYAIPETTISYVQSNPASSVVIDGDVAAGYELGSDVELVAIPDNPNYSYVYLNDRPALVDNNSRVVVWVK